MNRKNNFLIYGSYGYTGHLIAERSLELGLNPVLAGRNEPRLIQQAQTLNLEYRVLDLDNPVQTQNILQDFVAVINCAGPFIHTYKKMAEACIHAKTHYLDITGEIMVIEQLMAMNEEAKNAGIMLLPAAGFDVVPSDCLARYLKAQMPDAIELILAITTVHHKTGSKRGSSRGTTRTMLEGLSSGTLIRDEGCIKKVPLGWKTRIFDFGGQKKFLCSLISWGDIASAWWSTGIPHIETYMALPQKMIKMMKFINPIKGILNWTPIKRYFENKINQLPEGPSLGERQNSEMKVYGEVKNSADQQFAVLMTTPNGYTLTALSALLIMQKILDGNAPIGFQTPSSAYTEDLVMEIPGVTRIDV